MWQPLLLDLTGMSALKDGVVQEWGAEKPFSVSVLAATGRSCISGGGVFAVVSN